MLHLNTQDTQKKKLIKGKEMLQQASFYHPPPTLPVGLGNFELTPNPRRNVFCLYPSAFLLHYWPLNCVAKKHFSISITFIIPPFTYFLVVCFNFIFISPDLSLLQPHQENQTSPELLSSFPGPAISSQVPLLPSKNQFAKCYLSNSKCKWLAGCSLSILCNS